MVEGKQYWIVTGASSGIGAAVIKREAAAGHRVLALDVDDKNGELLAQATGATYLHCDVSDPEDWNRVSELVASVGAPTHLHLNAGIQIAPPDVALEEYAFDSMTVERYRKMMGVNVDGVVFGLHTMLPLMPDPSAIVVTASLAGITPYGIDPLYSLSKHGVVGLVRSLAPTLAKRGIKINAICPGGIDTALVPQVQRSAAVDFMSAEHIAEEVERLMTVSETGKTWAKVAESKPAFIIRAPGDKGK